MKIEANPARGKEVLRSNLALTAGLLAAWLGVASIIESRHRNRNYPPQRSEKAEKRRSRIRNVVDSIKKEVTMAKDVFTS